MLFLAQTQEHKDNGLNLLLRVLNNIFHLQMTSFARSPFCTTYLCDKWSKSDLCICRGSGGHSSEIREVWPIRRAILYPVFVILYSSSVFYVQVCGSYRLQRRGCILEPSRQITSAGKLVKDSYSK